MKTLRYSPAAKQAHAMALLRADAPDSIMRKRSWAAILGQCRVIKRNSRGVRMTVLVEAREAQ